MIADNNGARIVAAPRRPTAMRVLIDDVKDLPANRRPASQHSRNVHRQSHLVDCRRLYASLRLTS
jgi:hypothetical protein